MAKAVVNKINRETGETKKSDLDRLNWGKNVMAFWLKESTEVEDFEKSDMSFINNLFPAVKGVNKPTSLKHCKLEWTQNKVRLINKIFKDLEEKTREKFM